MSTTTAAAPERPRLTLAETFADSRVMAVRQLRKILRDRFRSLPIARSAVLLGRTAADAVVNASTLIVMVLVGLAVGFRPSEPVYDLALALVLVLGSPTPSRGSAPSSG